MSIYTNQSAPARAWLLIIPALALGLFLLLTSPAQPAAASCGGTTTVSNETELNNAIAAFNAVTTSPCVFTIELSGDIDLTASTTAIDNATIGVSLVIAGSGHAVDGQGTAGVRPFLVEASTQVTMNDLTVTGGKVTGSERGGGIRNRGILRIFNSTIAGNTSELNGGGINNLGAMVISDSTISGNTLQGGAASVVGGGIYSEGALTIRNSTISGNSSSNDGGGIGNYGLLNLDSVTVTGNSTLGTAGAGVFVGGFGTLIVRNSILAGNSNGEDCHTFLPILDGGHNLVQTQSGCGFVNGVNGNVVGQPAQLGPLADNGGPTWTHALLAGSPAIDAGDTTLTTDQRGEPRPSGAADDIGAYEAQVGTITIVKDADPPDGTDFDFALFAASPAITTPFTLDDADPDDGDGITDTISFTLPSGDYQVTELLPSGWALQFIQCEYDGSTVGIDYGENRVYIDLAADDDVTCTYHNSNQGTITIVKDATPPDGTDFDFALFAASPAITTPFTLDDADPDDGDGITDTISFTLSSGDYQVTEFLPSGWDLQFIQCEYDGSTVGIDYGENRVNIDLAAGDDVICTFNNNNRGSITIVKDADPPDGTDFNFTLDGDVSAPVDFTLDDADPDDGDPITDTVSFTLPSGDYNVTEFLSNRWALQFIQCEYDGSTVGIDYGENRVNIDLAAGDDVICTFNNSNRGTITIVKDATPPDGTDFDFALFAASPAITTPFTLDDADPDDGDPITDTISFTLSSGDYQVTEFLPSGWDLQFIHCEYDGSTVGIDYGENRVNIDLAAGDDVICTFNNNNVPTAVTLSGLEAVADRPALAWPWLVALGAAPLAVALVVWRRRHNAAG